MGTIKKAASSVAKVFKSTTESTAESLGLKAPDVVEDPVIMQRQRELSDMLMNLYKGDAEKAVKSQLLQQKEENLAQSLATIRGTDALDQAQASRLMMQAQQKDLGELAREQSMLGFKAKMGVGELLANVLAQTRGSNITAAGNIASADSQSGQNKQSFLKAIGDLITSQSTSK